MSANKAGALAGLRLLTASDILSADDIVREEVPTPEWGEGTGVLVQSMTANQRYAFQQAGMERHTEKGVPTYEVREDWNSTVALVVCSVVDASGEPMFSARDIDRLAEKNSAPIDRIADVARRLSRLRAEDREELSAGLKATNGSSPSDSQDI